MSRQGGAADGAVRLARWSVTSGSAAQSRGVVVIEGGDHHWRASATGNGAVDALFRAVDDALAAAFRATGVPTEVVGDARAAERLEGAFRDAAELAVRT